MDMTVFEAYTPPPEPVDATLNMKRVPVSTKSAESLEYMAPENVGCISTDARCLVCKSFRLGARGGGCSVGRTHTHPAAEGER